MPERERKEIRKKRKIERNPRDIEVRWIPPLIKEESYIHIPFVSQGTHLLRDVLRQSVDSSRWVGCHLLADFWYAVASCVLRKQECSH